MKKALGQTVRDLKREVNKKVLKVPSIEQKVLDATSNEPWGPHGSHLADIAQATRNYHEYQMIMSVIWKRINDTGKNWRHVYKALTVLEYMVANGSERVIDDIREHAYQISTLSEFQYIDSSGRDQGSNVRKKSQSLVVLVNDKERIQEVRQKAAANREKYRNSSTGGMYRPGSHSSGGGYGERYDDDRYGRERDEDRNNGYGRERDDERYGRYGVDSYGGPRDDDRSSRDSYKDDDYRGRSRINDDFNYGSRSRSADRHNGDRSYEDDGQYSSRESYSKGDDRSQDGSVTGKPIERKFSEQNLSAPPSYEEAVTEARSPVPHTERDEEIVSPPVPPKSSSPAPAPAPLPMPVPAQDPTLANKEGDVFDEFDPRGSFAAATPPASTGAEMDLLSSLSDSFESNQMALVPATTTIPETNTFSIAAAGQTNFSSFSASSVPNQQPFDDPFGDGPFRAILPATSSHTVNVHSSSSFESTSTSQNSEPQKIDTNNNPTFGSAEAYTAGPYATSAGNAHQKVVPSPQYSHQEPSNQNIDILADIFPPSLPQTSTSFQSQSTLQPGFPSQISQQQQHYPGQMGQVPGFHPQSHPVFPAGYPSQNMSQPVGFHAQPGQQNPNYFGNFEGGSYGPSPPSGSHMHHTSAPAGAALTQHNSTSSFIPQSTSSHVPANSNLSLALVPQQPPAQEKFETKSTVWADTLNRGLVNLNISGPKTNPLADIGVDFDSINRREKRMEKPSSTPVISNITMGKAMGSGSGMGRAGAGALRSAPRPNHMMGGTMGGGYAVNTPLHQQHMIGNMGMMNNMGNMVQQEGFPMHQQQPPPVGFPPRGYNPMAGAGGGFSQPYGGYPR